MVRVKFLSGSGFLLFCLISLGCTSISLEKTPNPDPLQIGICQPGSTPPEMLDDLGIKWIRRDLSWNRLEIRPGVWDFSSLDRYFEEARSQNRKILGVLAYDNTWRYKKDNSRRNIRPDELHHYLNYVRTVAGRYKDDLSALEIWNEPNFIRFWKGSDQDFYHLTKETLRVLEETAPDLPVTVGALSYHPVNRGKSFLKGMIAYGALEGADAVSLHPYGSSVNAVVRRVADVQDLLNKHKLSHQIWITEMGYPTTGLYPHRISLENHAVIIARTMVQLAAAGADLITWYKLQDAYTAENRPFYVGSEDSFGLIYPDLEWKPGAWSYRSLSRVLQDSLYDPSVVDVAGLYGIRSYGFRMESGETAVVLWSINEERESSIIIEGFKKYTVTELKGRDSLVLKGKGPLETGLTGIPLLISGFRNPGYPAIQIR